MVTPLREDSPMSHSHLALRSSARRLVALGALALCALAPSVVGADQAAAATSISGTVYADGYRQANATIAIQRWNGSAWTFTGRTARTGSTGGYSVTGLGDGWYYRVRATKTFGACFIGSGLTYYGAEGNYFLAQGGARGSNVHMRWMGFNPC
jgi:hypothetical protein